MLSAIWLGPPSSAVHAQQNPPLLTKLDEFGAINCVGCHGSKDGPSFKAYSEGPLKSGKFIFLNEYEIWDKHDYHSKAFLNIDPKTSPLAKKMQDTLKYNPTEDKRCLACHATARVKDAAIKELPNIKMTGSDSWFSTTSGVSCESCHGHAKSWFGEHFLEGWRKTAVNEKADKGLNDLRDPEIRTKKCLSCHVGNQQEGKFVTHEMFAAGHPPLPAFEVATFLASQPRHYYTARENQGLRNLEKDPQFKTWEIFHYRSGELAEARNVAIGSVVTFQETIKLFLDDPKKNNSLDFSNMNCYACHHELKIPSDRQAAGFPGVPGRPLIRPTSVELFEAVASCVDPEGYPVFQQKLDTALKEFQKGFDNAPFGDPKVFKSADVMLSGLSTEVLEKVKATKFDTSKSEELFRKLLDRVDERANKSKVYLDHDTARQLIWALEVVRKDLKESGLVKYSVTDDKVQAIFGKVFSLNIRDLNSTDSNKAPLAEMVKPRMSAIENFPLNEFREAFSVYQKLFP
ncbi:hypothetical protein KIH39_22435 [Telmatocola sphagniphila]|uniref:Cytochrome c-552/4 domain-containing protein n=1 Tax=Telmatocola sphagniphila TaxID=1123043 RepID=A0A8E6B518_9BACT|nr:cytochrome c family protein [Telmatocola sphagniphila]QVL31574.1 hypothetical protein KIH39_22435 [Telmatocola sphagniphila]